MFEIFRQYPEIILTGCTIASSIIFYFVKL